MKGLINMKNSKIYCCFSKPLRDFLTSKGIRYDICALNPNSKLMFWGYVRTDKLNMYLKEWSLKKRN